MTKSKLTLLLSLLLFLPPVQAEIFMGTDWMSTSMTYKNCIVEAKQTLNFCKFEKNLDYQVNADTYQSGSAWGEMKKGGYKAVIKCIESEGLVFFVVGGDNQFLVKEYLKSLVDNFKGGDSEGE